MYVVVVSCRFVKCDQICNKRKKRNGLKPVRYINSDNELFLNLPDKRRDL